MSKVKTKLAAALFSAMCLCALGGTMFLLQNKANIALQVQAKDFDFSVNVTGAYGHNLGTVGSKLTLRCSLGTKSEANKASGETQTIGATSSMPSTNTYGIDANWVYYYRWLEVKSIDSYATVGSSSLAAGKITLNGEAFDMASTSIGKYIHSGTAFYEAVTFDVKIYYNVKYALKLHGGSTGDATLDSSMENGTFYTYNTYDQTATTLSTLPTRLGYIFKGFYSQETGGTQVIDANGNFLWNQSTATLCELHAQWQANVYTLTADASGGTMSALAGWTINGSVATKSVAYDTAYGDLPVPTKEGFGFKGWFTLASGGTQVGSSLKMGASDTTIYAQWGLNQYTLTADCNGGSSPETAPSGWSKNGNTLNRPMDFDQSFSTLPEPTRQGYIFVGWFDAPSGGSEYTSQSKMPANALTIYAHWVESWVKYMTEEDPVLGEDGYYQIDSAEKLARMVYLVNYSADDGKWMSAKYKQTADIDLSAHYWQPIGHTDDFETGAIFSGESDGGAYDIKGLNTYCSPTERYTAHAYQGMFTICKNAKIQNLNLYDVNVIGSQFLGTIGAVSMFSQFINCRVTGGILYAYGDGGVGGIVGMIVGGSVVNCENYAHIKGGIAGGVAYAAQGMDENNRTLLQGSVNYGTIEGDYRTGGIVGTTGANTDIISCVNNGKVSSISHSTGGIVGQAAGGDFVGCVNNGDISGTSYVGGIAGDINYCSGDVTIKTCVSTGSLTITDASGYVSGIAGYVGADALNTTILSCYVDCQITAPATAKVQGIIGWTRYNVTINYCGVNISLTTANNSVSSFFTRSSGTTTCENSYSLINNGGTAVNKVTSSCSDLDNHFATIPSLLDGRPIPVGIYHISQFGTQTGIYSLLQTKYNITTE